MVLELREFQKSTLTPILQQDDISETLHLASVFPAAQSYDNGYAFDVIKQAARQASRITGFNATAPIRGFADIEQISGKLTKIQDSYYFDENDLLKINRPRTPEERESTINESLRDVVELSRGIDYTVEYLRAQLVYNGRLLYTDAGTEVSLDIQLDRPDGNDIAVTNVWDGAGATPIEDLQAAVAQYESENNGAAPDRMDISQKVESALLRNEQIRTEVYGAEHGGRIVRRAQLQELLSELGLPMYYVNKDKTAFVSIVDGVKKLETRKHLDDEKVVLYANEMGATVHGITVENNYGHGKFVEPVMEQNPRTESIIVGEAVIPALKAINSNVIMTVL